MALNLPNFRLAPFVAVTEAVADLGLPAVPPGGSPDPSVNRLFWSTQGLSDQSDPEAIYESLVTGAAPLAIKVGTPTVVEHPWWQDAIIGASTVLQAWLSSGLSLVTAGLERAAPAVGVDPKIIEPVVSGIELLSSGGGDVMGFLDDFSFDSFADFASGFVDEVDWGSVGSFGLDVAQNFMPQGGNQAVAIPVMGPAKQAAQAAAGAIARVGPTVGRGFFNKFPNLATAIQKMRNAGHNVSRSKLYSMLKRFGPEFLVTAGIMSAAAVSELLLAGPGHRRMNPANSKALRRATRRIKSFHRLCGEADVIKTRRRSCAKKC